MITDRQAGGLAEKKADQIWMREKEGVEREQLQADDLQPL